MTDKSIDQIMALAPVIPVIVIDRVEDAVPMAEALVAGGLPVLEVTLRTPAALAAIAAMKAVPGAVVGAGTVLDPAMLAGAIHAGAEFIVSPGLTDNLGKAAVASGIPFLPGTANAGDIMRGMDRAVRRRQLGRPRGAARSGPDRDTRARGVGAQTLIVTPAKAGISPVRNDAGLRPRPSPG